MRHDKSLGRGDIIKLSNDPKPKHNHEQKGYRPWLVVSEPILNANSPFVWAIPFTTTYREYPLSIKWDELVPTSETEGTLLCDQLATLDCANRDYRFVEHVEVPDKVDDLIKLVLGYVEK